jgi:hypothetical protein
MTKVQYSDFRKEPNRYLQTTEYDKWAPRVNMLEDLRGSSRILRRNIDKLKAEGQFDWEGKAKIATAVATADPSSALKELISSGALGTLTPDQRDFVIATQGLVEQAMGMRQILGAGGGSEDVRDAITKTLPGLMAPNADWALSQMDYFDGTLERVHRVIPKNVMIGQGVADEQWSVGDRPSSMAEAVQLRDVAGTTLDPRGAPVPGTARPGGGSQPQGRTKSLGAVMAWIRSHPNETTQRFGKADPSEDEVSRDMQSHGFTVRP